MPLIQSPIDGQPMRQIVRYGIEFDVCPSTGGVWLDRGELEKLIALVADETRAAGAIPTAPEQSRYRDSRREYEDHDDNDDGHRRVGDGRRKSRLSDLFDF